MEPKKLNIASLLAFIVVYHVALNKFSILTRQEYITAANSEGYEPEVVQSFDTVKEADDFLREESKRKFETKVMKQADLKAFVVIYSQALNTFFILTKKEYLDREFEDGYFWQECATFGTAAEAEKYVIDSTAKKAKEARPGKVDLKDNVVLYNEKLNAWHHCTRAEYMAAKETPGYDWVVTGSHSAAPDAEKFINEERVKAEAAAKLQFDEDVKEENRILRR